MRFVGIPGLCLDAVEGPRASRRHVSVAALDPDQAEPGPEMLEAEVR